VRIHELVARYLDQQLHPSKIVQLAFKTTISLSLLPDPGVEARLLIYTGIIRASYSLPDGELSPRTGSGAG